MLVVDDNATNRRILHDVLVNWKMKPTRWRAAPTASQRSSAARKAGASRTTLAIIDGQMPQMDGFMFASRVRRDRQLRATPLSC